MAIQKKTVSLDGMLKEMPLDQQMKLKFNWQLGRAVRERREELGWTVKDLQVRSGVKHTDITRFESQEKTFGTNTLFKLLAALGLELQIAVTESSNPNL